MSTEALKGRPSTASTPSIGNLAALIGSLLILIGYVALPLRSDGTATGLTFIDSSTTFPALTLIIGLVGLVSAVVGILAIREHAARWWFVGLGALGLVFLLDNTLRQKAAFSSGGWLAMLGCIVLIGQVALPRAGDNSPSRSQDTVLGLVRVLLGTLWFTQLLWKLPWNNYGCPAGPLVPAANTGGLCDWLGREIASPRWPAYKSFVESLIAPNLSWMAFFIVAGEAFVCFALLLGFFTRAGAIVGTLMGINLFVGLTAVPNEWDWTYLMLPALCAVFIVIGGRWIGIDAVIYPRLRKLADSGNMLGRVLVLFV